MSRNKDTLTITLDRIHDHAQERRRQADRIDEICRELAVLFGVDWEPMFDALDDYKPDDDR